MNSTGQRYLEIQRNGQSAVNCDSKDNSNGTSNNGNDKKLREKRPHDPHNPCKQVAFKAI